MNCNWRWLVPALLIVCASLPVLASCGSDEEEPQPDTKPQSSAVAEAKQYFQAQCVRCHGEDGKGRGKDAPPIFESEGKWPRDWTDPDWQANVTDGHIESVILVGGLKKGLSAQMPANPLLEGKPEVVAELRKIVRSYGKKTE